MSNPSQRDAFWTRIYQRALSDRNIVIISADMGAPALDQIRRDLPGQFINVGIAEQNAITIASGLALAGKKVFAYAIAPFITLRCLEQIRVENAIMRIPITIVGVGAGFGYEDSGPTHHIIEDLAIMRALPNITIHSVTDSIMAAAVADASLALDHSNYVRLDRQTLPDLYAENDRFEVGLSVLRPPGELCFVATGCMTHTALKLAGQLAEEGVGVGVIDLHTLPVNASALLTALDGVRQVVTLEEHFLAGGLGSAVCEVLADHGRLLPVKRLGLPLERAYCYAYGGREVIRGHYGLDEASLMAGLRPLLG